MNLHEPRLQNLYNGDPLLQEYHQDYQEGIYHPLTQGGTPYFLLLCLLPVLYQILVLLDYDLLPLPELLWGILVYLTPSRLLDAVEVFQNPLQIRNPALRGVPRTHAAKSEAMRRVLGLDKPGSIIGSVAQAGRRRISTLPGINMGAKNNGRPAGLGNWDNSCYQNSVLQGLASLDSLSGYLTHPKLNKETSDETETHELKMSEALRDLIAILNDPSSNGTRVWTPATLKNMSSWQQQDAQEYFSKVLDEIDKEIGKVARSRHLSQGFESNDCSNPTAAPSEPLAISTFRNPLEGLLAQRVGCTKCGHSEGLSMIPFNCLTVPLGRAWEYDVSECLDEYTKLEQIEGVECGKCTLLKNQRLLSTIVERTAKLDPQSKIHQQSLERLAAVTEALEDDDYEEKTLLQKCKITPKNRVSSTKTRQAVIARPPKSLVVHVNRSLFDELSGELKKNYSEVRFPKILDLGPWCLGSAGNAEDVSTEEWLLNPDQPMIASTRKESRLRGPIYELRAVLTHYGRHENGHYICYKKHPNPTAEDPGQKQQWWRLSDDDVIEVTEENVLGQGGVFMLFYDCIEPPIVISSDLPDLNRTPETTSLPEASIAEHVPSSEILALAAGVPLPETNDGDDNLLEIENAESISTATEDSVATSVSECDEEETAQEDEQDYQPTKAILVPPYIQQTGIHNEEKNAGQQRAMSSGSLVMV